MNLPTRKDLFATARKAIVNTPNIRINPSVIDLPGSDINLLVGAMSLMGEEVTVQLAKAVQGLFIETAREDALDRLAFDRYGVARFPATPAIVTLSFTALGAGVVPTGFRVQTTAGVQFVVDNALTFGGAGTQSVTATAVLTGPDSNVSAGTLTQFVDTPFAPTLTVTNSAGAAGGADAETDIQFRGRLRNFFTTVRRGTLGAIEYGALQVPQVAVATAYEVTTSSGFPQAIVNLVVADRDGSSNSAMIQAVENMLVEYRAGGIAVMVAGGAIETPHPQVEWHVSFLAGIDTSQAADQLRSATVAVAQYLKPGETLYRADILAAARTVTGVVISADSLVEPVGDVVPTSQDKLIRLDSTDITFV